MYDHVIAVARLDVREDGTPNLYDLRNRYPELDFIFDRLEELNELYSEQESEFDKERDDWIEKLSDVEDERDFAQRALEQLQEGIESALYDARHAA